MKKSRLTCCGATWYKLTIYDKDGNVHLEDWYLDEEKAFKEAEGHEKFEITESTTFYSPKLMV